MIQSYDLYMPVHLVFGRGRIAELPKLIAGYGKKVLLTYGGGSVKRIGLYDKVKALLAAEGCTVFELSGIEPNPKIESVRAGVEICKKDEHSKNVNPSFFPETLIKPCTLFR